MVVQLIASCEEKGHQQYTVDQFIEGLHRHAAIIACLLCMQFDYFTNIIKTSSLHLGDFNNTQILHYKKPQITPSEQLNLTINNKFDANTFKTHIIIQAYIPNEICGDIIELK